MLQDRISPASRYARDELDQISLLISPLWRKNMALSAISVAMVAVSVMNLAIILFSGAESAVVLLALFSVMGAVGMALYKESIYRKQDIQRLSLEHMKTRIRQGKLVAEERKRQFMDKIDQEPMQAVQTFCEYLSVEERTLRTEGK